MARVPKPPPDGRAAANAAMNPKPHGRRYKLVDVEYAITQSNGILAHAAKMIGCTPVTVWRWINRHPRLQRAVLAASMQRDGAVETILTNAIANSGKIVRVKCEACQGAGSLRTKSGKQVDCGHCEGVGSRVVAHESLTVNECLSYLSRSRTSRARWGTHETVEHTGQVNHAHAHLVLTPKMLELATDEELDAIRDGDRTALARVAARGGGGAPVAGRRGARAAAT